MAIRGMALAMGVATLFVAGIQAVAQGASHTDPLNVEPAVRAAYERFYILDYDGALKMFEDVAKAHPQEPMAWDYVLMAHDFSRVVSPGFAGHDVLCARQFSVEQERCVDCAGDAGED